MAISPEDCLKLEDSEKKQVVGLEKVIDTQLKAKFDAPDTAVTIIPGQMSAKVLKEILRLYRAVGWTIEHLPGETGSLDTLVFSKPVPKNTEDRYGK